MALAVVEDADSRVQAQVPVQEDVVAAVEHEATHTSFAEQRAGYAVLPIVELAGVEQEQFVVFLFVEVAVIV